MKRKERFFGVLLGLVLALGLTAGLGAAAYADDTAYDPALAYTEFGALNTNDTEVSENVGGVMHPLVMHKGEIISADEIKEMLANDGIVQATYEGAAVTLDLEDKTTLAQTTDANGTVVADSYTAVNPGTETITLTCSVTPDGSGGADQSCFCEWEVYVLDNVTYNASQGSLVVNGLSEYSSYEIYRVQNASDDFTSGELVKTFDASELTFRNLEDHAFYRVDQRDKASGKDDGSTLVVTGDRVSEYVSPSPSPRITGVTETTITVRAEPGKEYSIDDGDTWADASSRIIDDLPSGTYKVVEIVDGINFASPDTYAPHVIDKDEAGNPLMAVTITKEPQDPLVFPLRVEPSMTSATIFWYEEEIGQQFLVLPNGQEPTELDWNDKAVKAGRESDSFVIDGLTQDTEYVLYRRTPGDATHDPSDAFSLNFRTKKFVELTDANKPTVRIQRRGDFVYGNKPKVGDYLSAWATAYPVEYQLYYADENGNPTGDPIETDHDRWVKPADNGKRIVAVAIQKVDVSGETLMTPKTATSAPTDAVTLKDNTTVPETGDIGVWISTDTTASPATDTVTVKPTKGGYEYLVTTSMDAPSDADWANAAASTCYKETAAGTNNDGHAFTGLATGAQYYVHVRQAATDDTSASQSSVVPAPPNPASSAVDANCLTETITPKEGYEILNMSDIWIKAPGAIYPFEPERIYQVRKAADDANGSPPSLPVDYRAPARPAAPVKPVVTAVDAVPGSASVSIGVSPVNNAATYTVKDGSSNPVLILTPDAEHPGTFNVTRPDGSAADPAAVTAEGSPAAMTVGGLEPNKTCRVEAIIAATVDTLASDPVYSDYVTTRKGTLDESIINNNPAYQVKANNDPALVYDGYEYELVKAPAAVPDGYTMRYGTGGDGGAIAWSSRLPAASNAGSYEVYVKYAGDADHDDLVLTAPIAVTIAPRNINDANMTVSFDRTSFTYNGQLQGPSVTVRDIYTDLARNIDYELQESPTAADVGDYTVKVVGKGNYTGEESQDYSITKYMLADGDRLTASFSEHAFTYNGYDQHPIPDTTIVMLNNDVVPAEYCAWEYSEDSDGSIDVGVYSVQITLHKNYGGSRPVMYTIAPKSIEDADVTKTFAGTEFIYSDAEQGPAVSVHYGGIRLHEGTDYTVENQKNTDTGTYTAKITGTGNYTGVVTQTYEIKPCNTDSGGKIIVTFPDNNKDSFPYSGEVQKPEASGIVVKLNNTTLTADDYSISYSDPDSRNAGAYWVTVTLSDNYGGKLTQKAYTITAQTLSTITGSPLAFTYNGDPQGPETIVVTGSDNKTLTGDIDYYTPLDMTATDAGDYNLIAAGKGNYEGTVSLEYIIRKADPALTAPTARALSYTGSAQKLVIAGESSDGEMLYAVTAENEAPPDFRQYTASIPTGTDAGRYHVWYMVKGDQNHNDSSAQKLEVIILPIPGTPDFTLPAAIRTNKESAFEGAAMTVVDIPDGCESIGANAFKDCANLTQIHIPAGCAIGDGAFFGCGTVYIFAPAGSPAESFCAAPANANCVFCETAD